MKGVSAYLVLLCGITGFDRLDLQWHKAQSKTQEQSTWHLSIFSRKIDPFAESCGENQVFLGVKVYPRQENVPSSKCANCKFCPFKNKRYHTQTVTMLPKGAEITPVW